MKLIDFDELEKLKDDAEELEDGSIASATVIQPVLMFIITFISNMISTVLLPLVLVATALSIISKVSDKVQIDKIANFTNTIENSTMVSQQTKNSLNTIKTDLLVSAKILQQTLKEVLTEEDENVLNIKLPEKYSSISDYIKFFETLN